MLIISANAFLCILVWFCVHNFPQGQRGDGKFAASALTLNWLLYISTKQGFYDLIGTDISPAYLINHSLGYLAVSHEAIWAYTDALTAVLIVIVCYKFWWAYALWALYTMQLYMHYLRNASVMDFSAYSYILDLLFVALVAVFVTVGGKGTLDHVHRLAGDLHVRWFRSFRGALQRARAPGSER